MNKFQINVKGFFVACVACAMTVGCATPKPTSQFILLPETGGKAGGLQVTADGKDVALSKPYEKAVATTAKTLEVRQSSKTEVDALAGDAMRALPPVPTKYILYFMTGSDKLTKESEQVMETMLQELKARPAPELTIVGHTDTQGDSKLNDKLSMGRAEVIRSIVIKMGVSPEQILVAGRGERELLVNTPDNVNEPKNRRVEVIIR